MKLDILPVLAAGLVLFTTPALAGPDDTLRMRGPFPALMEALTGHSGESRTAVRSREVPQPRFAQPQRDNRYVARSQPERRASQPTRSVTAYRSSEPAPRRVVTNAHPAMDQRFLPTVVPYDGRHAAGTIVIDTDQRFLYLVQNDGTARRYGVGVGRPGFDWAGTHRVTRKAEWPGWTPPAAMRKRQPGLPAYMPGGPDNPLGARALYLGSTLYRIHGTSQPWTIGQAVSSGCIRMRNEDVIDLYQRVGVGTRVIVS